MFVELPLRSHNVLQTCIDLTGAGLLSGTYHCSIGNQSKKLTSKMFPGTFSIPPPRVQGPVSRDIEVDDENHCWEANVGENSSAGKSFLIR